MAVRERLEELGLRLPPVFPPAANYLGCVVDGDLVHVGGHGPINGDLDISTFNGEIRNCFGPKPTRTSEYAPGRELRFEEGNGTSRIRVKTLNGDISVCRR